MKTKYFAIYLMIFSTLFTSTGQLLFKIAANKVYSTPIGYFLNFYIIIGGILYVAASILTIIAFRNGEITILYPILGTSFIWISILSLYVLKEPFNFFKWIGVISIVFGVYHLGIGGNKKVSQLRFK